jgi:hypothetical protein
LPDLQLNPKQLLEIVNKNYNSNQIVSVIAINLLAEILQSDQELSQQIVPHFEKPESYTVIKELFLNVKKINKFEEIRKIEVIINIIITNKSLRAPPTAVQSTDLTMDL